MPPEVRELEAARLARQLSPDSEGSETTLQQRQWSLKRRE